MGLDMILTSILLAVWFLLPVALVGYYLFTDKDSAMYKRPHYRPFKLRNNGFLKKSLRKQQPDFYLPYIDAANYNYSDKYKYFFSDSSSSDHNFYSADM